LKDIDAFITVFGDITVLQVIEIVLAVGFCVAIWKKVKKYLIDKHEAEKVRDEKLNTALQEVSKYPQYRAQSIKIQKELESQIQVMHDSLGRCIERLEKMEDSDNRRTRNQLRDRLLQSYRYYTSLEKNPSQSWTRMESEAFWELFHDYEDAGGNGYMHTDVLPAMERLNVVEVGTPLHRGE